MDEKNVVVEEATKVANEGFKEAFMTEANNVSTSTPGKVVTYVTGTYLIMAAAYGTYTGVKKLVGWARGKVDSHKAKKAAKKAEANKTEIEKDNNESVEE